MLKITRKEAGEFLLKYQNLYNPRQLKTDIEIISFIRRIGCIQYDPLNTVARNADLVLQSRCRDYEEKTLYDLLYEKRALLDGWDKNMSIWCKEDWPFFGRKRDGYRNHYRARDGEFTAIKKLIRKKLKDNSCLSSKDVDGSRKVGWSWAPTDIGRAVLESMYHCGELVIHHREGTRKYYGKAEKLLPADLLNTPEPNRTAADFCDWYVKRRIGSIGLLWNKSGDAWLGSQLKKEERSRSVKRLIDKAEISEVKITGIEESFYMLNEYAQFLDNNEKHHEAAVIAPLDNLIWDRKLIAALFQFDYKWEVYTPARERKYGYYVLPVVCNGSFIGRCEPVTDRKTGQLIIQNWWWETGVKIDINRKEALTRCFREFARFLKVREISIAGHLAKREFNWLQKCL